MRHTPGPWKFGKELSAHSGEWLISYDAADRGQGIPIAETRPGSGQESANARLIAAAPELLEALEAALACGLVPKMTAKDGGAAGRIKAVQAGDKVRAAIAKARGEG